MKLKFLSFFIILGFLHANAVQVSSDDALRRACEFFNSDASNISFVSSKNHIKPFSAGQSEEFQPFYVFNRGTDEGFVIIAGDDASGSILGYSHSGNFDFKNIPPQLLSILKSYSSVEATHNSRRVPRRSDASEGQKEILLQTPNWGQFYPYNAQCPVFEGLTAPSGCVATAMAIVMKYYNWPEAARGGEKTNFYFPEIKFDFSDYNIDWDLLSSEDTDNLKYVDEISRLFYGLGTALNMMYGIGSSGAEVWPASFLLMHHFLYSPECQFIQKSHFSDEDWYEMIDDQLSEGCPVIYTSLIYTDEVNTDAHAYVIDGCDASGLYHINWGWEGSSNGYYVLEQLIPEKDKDEYLQGMIINIKPDYSKKEYANVFFPNADVYLKEEIRYNRWNFSTSDIIPGEPVSVSAPHLTNMGFDGYIALAVADEDDNILQILEDSYVSMWGPKGCVYSGAVFTMENVCFPELKEGQRYQVVSLDGIVYGDYDEYMKPSADLEDPANWKIVLGGMVVPSHFSDKGNFSDVVDVSFHVDENIPYKLAIRPSCSHEFTVKTLRGNAMGFADNIYFPRRDASFEITCYDKDGNPKEPVMVVYDNDPRCISFNVSPFEDKTDIWVRYNKPNSRRDENIPENLIIEEQGLVYKINGSECTLIGYDADKLEDKIIIPDFVTKNGIDYTLTSIDEEALLNASCSYLSIESTHLCYEGIGAFAFANIKNLKEVSYGTEHNVGANTILPFLGCDIKRIYFNSTESAGMHWDDFTDLYQIEQNKKNYDYEYYLCSIGDTNSGLFELNFFIEHVLIAVEDGYRGLKPFKAIYIPGRSSHSEYVEYEMDGLEEMWDYGIDKSKRLIKIKPNIENINIDKVTVNDIEVSPCDEYLYSYSADSNFLNVEVFYTLNESYSTSTLYSAHFNGQIVSEDLSTSGVEATNNLRNDYCADVYDLLGNLLARGLKYESLSTLDKGIYLIKTDKNVVKKIFIP